MAGESALSVCRPCELDYPGNKRLFSDREVCLKRLFSGESSSQGFHRQYPRIQRNLRLRVLSFAFLRPSMRAPARLPVRRPVTLNRYNGPSSREARSSSHVIPLPPVDSSYRLRRDGPSRQSPRLAAFRPSAARACAQTAQSSPTGTRSIRTRDCQARPRLEANRNSLALLPSVLLCWRLDQRSAG